MTFDRKTIIEFIKKYRELECLWKKTDEDYKNKYKRSNAMTQLAQILKKSDPTANIASAGSKINTLRSSFYKEYNKVKASYQSGVDAADVHVPKLWYYNSMLFILQRNNEPTKSSDIDAVLPEVTASSHEDMDFDTKMGQNSPRSRCSSMTSVSQQSAEDVSNKFNRKTKNLLTERLLTKKKRLDSYSHEATSEKPAFSIYGEHVAEKLRTMPKHMALYCQKLINDAIFQAEFGKLNDTSHIVTYPKHLTLSHQLTPPSPPQSYYQSPHDPLN